MRTLGLLGGMSWESTALYYRLINQQTRTRLGGLHSASMLLHSFDFAQIAALQHDGRWEQAGLLLGQSAARLEQMGAAGIVLCTNTMHKVAHVIDQHISVPLLHLADATALRIAAAGYRRVALLGTQFTMQETFYSERLQALDLEVLVPDRAAQQEVNRVIYEELCQGVLHHSSRAYYSQVVQELAARGADCVILGCTEITLLVGASDLCLPSFDTTAIHAEAAVDFALAD